MIKKIKLKNSMTSKAYTEFCNMCERQGVLVSSGPVEDKHVILNFKDEIDFMAWYTVLGGMKK